MVVGCRAPTWRATLSRPQRRAWLLADSDSRRVCTFEQPLPPLAAALPCRGAGATAIAAALATNTTLKKLIFEFTAVGDKGVAALAAIVPTSGLARLDFG